MNFKKRILVAPLNWGLGHATRCIPIINALLEQQYEPIIASDGVALNLLKKEFPSLMCLELPSYHIQYSKHGFLLKWQLLKNVPKLFKAILEERKLVQKIIKTHQIEGIISDNRFGVYSLSKAIPSVYITHQLHVFSGIASYITTRIHQKIIKKYEVCWVPDFEIQPNLSGKLGHLKNHNLNLKYLGTLSRFTKTDHPICYSIMVLLSGPEPQRSLLEEKLLRELKNYEGPVILIRGVVETTQTKTQKKNITLYNFMTSDELGKAIQSSQTIISRSGYTTIMDLAKLEKKAFFIPTPGQYEQWYLAKRLDNMKIAPYCKQEDFTINKLKRIDGYSGFNDFKSTTDFKTLFSLFERE